MINLASYLGDTISKFFRRPEVRRTMLDVLKSSGITSSTQPSVQIIPGEGGSFQERVEISCTNAGQYIFYNADGFITPVSGPVNLTPDIELTEINIRVDAYEGITPNIKEIIINGTKYVSTDGYDDSGISIYDCTSLEWITFSPNVQYVGINDGGVQGYFEFNGCFPKVRGEGLVRISDINYNTSILDVNTDLSNAFPAGVTIESLDFYGNSGQSDLNSFITPACTIKEMFLANFSFGFALDTLDISNTTFIYENGDLRFFPGITNLVLPVGAKQMPFSISFDNSPNINWDNVEELLQLLIDLDGTNGTTTWVGELFLENLPEPTQNALTLIGILIDRGATVTYTQP
jgi:hypothetical protein